MKKRIFFTSLIFLAFYVIFAGTSFNKNETHQINSNNHSSGITPSKDFINFILNWGYKDSEPHKWVLNHLDVYRNQLGFNGIHTYPTNSDKYGRYENALTQPQIDSVKSLMATVNNAGLKGVYSRIKIAQLCDGQRVVYEPAPSNGLTNINDGFCYQTKTTGEYLSDEGDKQSIIKCLKNTDSPGYIAKDIYENLQHSDIFFQGWSDEGTWYIKPRLKINTYTSITDTVVRIDIIKFNGQLLKSVNIKVSDFGATGVYVNEFSSIASDLSCEGSKTTGNLNEGKPDGDWVNGVTGNISKTCGVDFRIYWYGKVDVWFDNMIAENQISKQLFDGNHDSKNRR